MGRWVSKNSGARATAVDAVAVKRRNIVSSNSNRSTVSCVSSCSELAHCDRLICEMWQKVDMKMRIVIGYDGSESADAALDEGLAL